LNSAVLSVLNLVVLSIDREQMNFRQTYHLNLRHRNISIQIDKTSNGRQTVQQNLTDNKVELKTDKTLEFKIERTVELK
jgi:hypothetical protein